MKRTKHIKDIISAYNAVHEVVGWLVGCYSVAFIAFIAQRARDFVVNANIIIQCRCGMAYGILTTL